jgi:hypothetical protein
MHGTLIIITEEEERFNVDRKLIEASVVVVVVVVPRIRPPTEPAPTRASCRMDGWMDGWMICGQETLFLVVFLSCM